MTSDKRIRDILIKAGSTPPGFYIDGFGYRNPVKEKDNIIFILNQIAKKFKNKNQITRFWLDQYEKKEVLLRMEAFELVVFLESKVSQKQVNKRIEFRAVKDIKDHIQLQELLDQVAMWKLLNSL